MRPSNRLLMLYRVYGAATMVSRRRSDGKNDSSEFGNPIDLDCVAVSEHFPFYGKCIELCVCVSVCVVACSTARSMLSAARHRRSLCITN